MVQPAEEIFYSAGVRASLLEYLHACPICKHSELCHYCRVPSLFNDGEFIHYERCAACGVVLRNPRLPSRYRETRYRGRSIPLARKSRNPATQAHYGYSLRLIRRLLPQTERPRLLDFGCGTGGFLVEARKAGFEVMGLELSHELAVYVRAVHGFPVFEGLVSEPAFEEQKFNVIIASQVFEHLLDPTASLQEIMRHLTAPGVILIEVPNLQDFRERLRRGATMDDAHLFYFSRKSLTRLLTDAGLRVLAVEDGLRPFRFLGQYTHLVPTPVIRLAQGLFSVVQIKTGLSAIALLPS